MRWRVNDHVAVMISFIAGQNGDGLLPFVAEPAVVADLAFVVPKEDVRGSVFIDPASAASDPAAMRVKHHCIFVGVFFADRHRERLAGGVGPGSIGGVHLHVVRVVAIVGVAATFVARMINIRGGDRVALALLEPGVPHKTRRAG